MYKRLFIPVIAITTVILFAISCKRSPSITLSEKYAPMLTQPHGYVAYRTSQQPVIDGRINESDWQAAPWTEPFCDISGEGHPTPRYLTQAKFLWDDDNLYIAAQLEEPNVWATLTKHDEIVFHDPDFEVFIDPDGDAQHYFEIEVNALETVFDLYLNRPYRSPEDVFVTFAYDTPGLRIATHVDGTLNNATDTDRGWTVEMAIPRTAIANQFDNNLKAGNYLRVGMSRVEWQTTVNADGTSQRKCDDKGKLLSEDNWTWGPTGKVNMHMPERWGYVFLSTTTVGTAVETFSYPEEYEYDIDRLLWMMFYEQEEQYRKSDRYHHHIKDFHLTDQEIPAGTTLDIESTSSSYTITATDSNFMNHTINHLGKIRCYKQKIAFI